MAARSHLPSSSGRAWSSCSGLRGSLQSDMAKRLIAGSLFFLENPIASELPYFQHMNVDAIAKGNRGRQEHDHWKTTRARDHLAAGLCNRSDRQYLLGPARPSRHSAPMSSSALQTIHRRSTQGRPPRRTCWRLGARADAAAEAHFMLAEQLTDSLTAAGF